VTFVLFTETQAKALLRDLAEHEAATLNGMNGPALWSWVALLSQELGLGEFSQDRRGLDELGAALDEFGR
jgi:hypothetical protein